MYPLSTLVLVIVLAVSIFTDLSRNKIYNVVCAGALGLAFVIYGLNGEFWQSFAAALVAFLIFLPFYALKGMSAGDVKLMTACAALLGWPYGVFAVGWTLVSGTIAGLIVYCVRGGVSEVSERYLFAVKCLVSTGKMIVPAAPEDSVAKSRFPYAVAIAAGCLLSLIFHAP